MRKIALNTRTVQEHKVENKKYIETVRPSDL